MLVTFEIFLSGKQTIILISFILFHVYLSNLNIFQNKKTYFLIITDNVSSDHKHNAIPIL